MARASWNVRATFPPAVGAAGLSVDFFGASGPRAAWGSEGPFTAFFTQRLPSFLYECLREA